MWSELICSLTKGRAVVEGECQGCGIYYSKGLWHTSCSPTAALGCVYNQRVAGKVEGGIILGYNFHTDMWDASKTSVVIRVIKFAICSSSASVLELPPTSASYLERVQLELADCFSICHPLACQLGAKSNWFCMQQGNWVNSLALSSLSPAIPDSYHCSHAELREKGPFDQPW